MKKLIFTAILSIFATLSVRAQEPVSWTFKLADKGSGEIELAATAEIDDGWHLYDVEIPEGGPVPTSLEIDEIAGATAVGGFEPVGSKLIEVFDNVFQMKLGYYDKKAVFVQRFRVTDKSAFTLKGDVRAMACSDNSCTPPTPVGFSFTSSDLPPGTTQWQGSGNGDGNRAGEGAHPQAPQPGETDGSVKGETGGFPNVKPLTTGDGLPPAAYKNGGESDVQPRDEELQPGLWEPVIEELRAFGAAGNTGDRSLLWIFLLGFGGGLLALLTPCVWPMIPLTVSFFLKQERSRKGALRDAAIYGLSIIVIYVALGLVITGIFGATALNNLATNAVVNLLFFALLVVFAVSFFGAFELTLPSKWTNSLNDKADRTGGLVSIFLMAFILTLVSFSCTGPIIGTLLVDAASSGMIAAPALGMFGFALALAIPFALFAIFPSWLKELPRSGGWMNSVKVVLGFLELALALKFLSVADLAYGWGILDREVFLVLWIVIFTLLGIYLLGKIRFPHDGESKPLSVPRLFLSILSLAFALYMVPGLWGAPLKAISAFPPPLSTQDFSLYDGEVHARFDDYEEGMDYARRNGKPVLIDFSGLGCVNCREMEAKVWTDPRVKSILDNDYVLITLMVDDRERLPETIEVEENGRTTRLKTVGDRWSYLQRHKFGTNSQPYYVLLDPEGKPIGPSYAYNESIPAYLEFLDTGLENFRNR